jgi:hypothetical protein
MITNSKAWRRAEREIHANERLSRAQARRIYESLYQEARQLGVFPLRDPLDGLEDDLRLASALNRLRPR